MKNEERRSALNSFSYQPGPNILSLQMHKDQMDASLKEEKNPGELNQRGLSSKEGFLYFTSGQKCCTAANNEVGLPQLPFWINSSTQASFFHFKNESPIWLEHQNVFW